MCKQASTIIEKLIEYGLKIYEYRSEFIEKIKNKIKNIHKEITNNKEEIEIEYFSDAKTRQNFINELKSRRKLDIIKGFTTKGIHRDDFIIYIIMSIATEKSLVLRLF